MCTAPDNLWSMCISCSRRTWPLLKLFTATGASTYPSSCYFTTECSSCIAHPSSALTRATTLQEVAEGFKAFFPIDDTWTDLERRATACPDDKHLQIRLADLIQLQYINGSPARLHDDARRIYESSRVIEASCTLLVNRYLSLHHDTTDQMAIIENGFSASFLSVVPL